VYKTEEENIERVELELAEDSASIGGVGLWLGGGVFVWWEGGGGGWLERVTRGIEES